MYKKILLITAITALTFTNTSYSAPNTKSRSAALNRINKLIALSRKASADIRREVKRLESRRDKRIKASELKAARSLAVKLSRYARFLERKKKSFGKNERNLKRDLKTISDTSHKLQFEIQSANDRRQRTMKTITNILKKYNSTSSGIVRNLKG
jgi:predicted  nucleic acid-binding Zn-ribbon protein